MQINFSGTNQCLSDKFSQKYIGKFKSVYSATLIRNPFYTFFKAIQQVLLKRNRCYQPLDQEKDYQQISFVQS